MALNACDIDFKSAAWGLRNGFCETSGAANEEQRLDRRMSFGSQLNIARLGELYYLCCTFIPPLSHTSLELMEAIFDGM